MRTLSPEAIKVAQIGAEYESLLCEDCKGSIARHYLELTKWDLLRPKRLALKSVAWICADCRLKIEKKMKGE